MSEATVYVFRRDFGSDLLRNMLFISIHFSVCETYMASEVCAELDKATHGHLCHGGYVFAYILDLVIAGSKTYLKTIKEVLSLFDKLSNK